MDRWSYTIWTGAAWRLGGVPASQLRSSTAMAMASSDLSSVRVTFLLTDVENSTRLWEEDPRAMRAALARHDALAAEGAARHRGELLKARGEGDSCFIVFENASDALRCALALQLAFHNEPWPEATPIRVRMALHAGEAELRGHDYYGPDVNRCARLRAAAHGGQTIVSRAVAALCGADLPVGASLTELGRVRLKDLARPEEVFQLCHPELRDDFPRLRSLDVLRHNLPVQTTSFIGRDAEVAQLRDRVDNARLVTLTGAGGAGKTRLALQAAAERVDEFPGGVWLAELAALGEPALVPAAVATAVGVREEPGRDLLLTIADAVGSSGTLLIVDNCEHLVEACAELAGALLKGCPELKILATSREPLGVAGEAVWRVPSLGLPQEHPDPESLAEVASVALFCDRAALTESGFRLSPANAEAVAEICRRLDGIPLAIELAAARVAVMSPAEIVSRLDRMFGLLTGGARTAVPRQRTLAAAIDWSYDLLTEEERGVFRALSVFAGGFTLEAAGAVAGDGESDTGVLDVVSSLLQRSLIQAEEHQLGTRYRLLEPLRAYGEEKLRAAGEETTVRDRHLAYFRSLAERAEPELSGSDQTRWLIRLDAEQDNLRAALAYGIESEVEDAAALAARLLQFFSIRGHLTEGRGWLDAALSVASSDELRAKSLIASGHLAWEQSDFPAAIAAFEEGLEICRRMEDKSGIAACLNNLGNIASAKGDYPAARAAYEESLAVRREIGDKSGIATSLNNLGNLAYDQADYPSARATLEESLVAFRELGDKRGMAAPLMGVGNVACAQGDYPSARRAFEESVAICRDIGDRPGLGYSLLNLGGVAAAQGDGPAARAASEEAVAIFREVEDKRGMGYSLLNVGAVASEQGDYPSARAAYQESLAILREIGDRRGVAGSLTYLGGVASTQGDYPAARAASEEALAIFREIGDQAGIGWALHNLGVPARAQEDYPSARAAYEESLAIRREIGDKAGIAGVLGEIAHLAVHAGQIELACRFMGAAVALRDGIGAKWEPAEVKACEELTAAARSTLGDEEFERAWAVGQSLAKDEGVAEALTWIRTPTAD